jgi:hypothetical protein
MQELGHDTTVGLLEERKAGEIDDNALPARTVCEAQGVAQQPVGRNAIQGGEITEPFQGDPPPSSFVVAE